MASIKGFIDRFNDWFRNEIDISISHEGFEFKNNERSVFLKPYLILSDDERQIVLAVGAPYVGTERYVKVELIPFVELTLMTFLGHGFREVTRGLKIIVRPQLRIKFSGGLNLNTEMKKTFASAAFKAQARSVKFPDELGKRTPWD